MKHVSTATAHSPDVAISQTGTLVLRIAFRLSFVLTIGIIALVAIWSVACLIGGAASAGPFGMIKGWFGATMGL